MDYKTTEGKALIMRLANARDVIMHQPNEHWTEEMEEVLYYMWRKHIPVSIITHKFSISKMQLYRKVKVIRAKKIALLRAIDGESPIPRPSI